MAVLFTADTHFGDARTIAIHRRPFANAAVMDAAMLERWNAAVAPDDEVWHLGDFARTAAQAAGLLAVLHGRKHLLAGNNDPPAVRALPGWASVRDYAETVADGVPLVLCHYALRTWRNMGRGWVNLHGHSHGRLKPLTRQRDAGVDAWDFRPVPLSALLARRAGRR